MRRLDHLEIAITEAGSALLKSMVRQFVWGPVEESLSFVDGRVFGRISTPGWGTAGPRLAAASSDLTVVSLWPMLDLPTDVEPASPTEFARTLCRVLTSSDIWILWSELDFDQRPVPELELSAAEASHRVLQLLEESRRLDLVAYSPSAADRLSPRPPLPRGPSNVTR